MQTKLKIIRNGLCRMCDGSHFEEVINFGRNPLVNSLIEAKDISSKEPTFSLKVWRCVQCGLVQIKDIVNSDEIYKNVDYLYFSSDMPKLDEYFKEYAEDLAGRFIQAGDLVVEIGSNDGLMLKMFQDKARTLGVDPASNVVVRALKNGVPTISDFFTNRLAHSIEREFGKAKLIYGNNCIAHLNNLHDLISGVRDLLCDDGVFVVECNYWGNMVKNKNYALIYHDHFSYFSAQNWVNFGEEYGLHVFDAVVTPAQGGSLRIFLDKGMYALTPRLCELLQEEKEQKLNSLETCQQYEKDVRAEANKLFRLILKIKMDGKKIAGYGAAAKGFSVLKLANITGKYIDYFVDDSPAKQGKYTPVTRIPVISRLEAESKLPDYFFITAPNYEDIIIQKELIFRQKGGKFITIDSRIIT